MLKPILFFFFLKCGFFHYLWIINNEFNNNFYSKPTYWVQTCERIYQLSQPDSHLIAIIIFLLKG